MPRDSKFILRLTDAAIFIFLEIAALAMLHKSATLQDIWLNRASHFVMAKLWSGSENLRNHFSLKKQNEALYLDNFRLSQELLKYKQRDEAMAEAAGIKVADDRNFNYLPATVTKISRNNSHNYIILNKGSEDGVKPYSGIISGSGVVGIISAVGRNYSYGLTLMNSNISISARVGRTGMVGPVVWDGRNSNGAVLMDMPLHFDIQPGDTLYTSGFSSIFPPDIPIGITGNSSVADGSTNETDVTLFQDFSSLRYVTVVENPARDELEELEKGEVK